MAKTYNFLDLIHIRDFDVRKQLSLHGSKELLIMNLYNFTSISEVIISKWNIETLEIKEIDTERLAADVDTLKKLLADIGAEELVHKIEQLDKFLVSKDNLSYTDGLSKIFPFVDMLRQKIVKAENTSDISSEAQLMRVKNALEEKADAPKEIAKVNRDKFERLYKLIDNFEFDSALSLIKSIKSFSYTPEIDETLEEIFIAMEAFDFDNALKKASRLLGAAMSMDKAKKRILAIDDTPDVLHTIRSILKDKYVVYGMTNYNSIVKFLRDSTADLVLLDVEMKEMDGFALFQLIRKLPGYEKTPVVFLSDVASPENVLTAINLGVSGFIKKPVEVEVLVKKLEKMFEMEDNRAG